MLILTICSSLVSTGSSFPVRTRSGRHGNGCSTPFSCQNVSQSAEFELEHSSEQIDPPSTGEQEVTSFPTTYKHIGRRITTGYLVFFVVHHTVHIVFIWAVQYTVHGKLAQEDTLTVSYPNHQGSILYDNTNLLCFMVLWFINLLMLRRTLHIQ